MSLHADAHTRPGWFSCAHAFTGDRCVTCNVRDMGAGAPIRAHGPVNATPLGSPYLQVPRLDGTYMSVAALVVHCPRDHALTPANAYRIGTRLRCRACLREASTRQWARVKAARA